MSRRRRHAAPDGLGFPDWLGGLIVSAGSAVAGAVATRISEGSPEARREEVNRSLTFQFEAARMQQEQKSQEMFTMAGLGLGAIVLVSLLK